MTLELEREAGMRTPVPFDKKLTFEEFLDWCDEDTRAEWVDGEVVMVAPASNGMKICGVLWYASVAVPGFRLRTAWLWQEPLPKILDVVRELGLLSS